MIISVVLVSMMVVFVTVYHFVTKPKKQQEKIYSAMTTDELIRFVQSMHCELVKRIDADAIIIGFQGGYFHLLREKTGQNIQLYELKGIFGATINYSSIHYIAELKEYEVELSTVKNKTMYCSSQYFLTKEELEKVRNAPKHIETFLDAKELDL